MRALSVISTSSPPNYSKLTSESQWTRNIQKVWTCFVLTTERPPNYSKLFECLTLKLN